MFDCEKMNDLILVHYYDGVYSAQIQDEYGIADAVEFYFTWLTGMANKYDINADYDETPDGIECLRDDIIVYLEEQLQCIDLEEQFTNAKYYIEERGLVDEENQVDDWDIFEAVDYSEMDYKSIIYEHVIEEFRNDGFIVLH